MLLTLRMLDGHKVPMITCKSHPIILVITPPSIGFWRANTTANTPHANTNNLPQIWMLQTFDGRVYKTHQGCWFKNEISIKTPQTPWNCQCGIVSTNVSSIIESRFSFFFYSSWSILYSLFCFLFHVNVPSIVLALCFLNSPTSSLSCFCVSCTSCSKYHCQFNPKIRTSTMMSIILSLLCHNGIWTRRVCIYPTKKNHACPCTSFTKRGEL